MRYSLKSVLLPSVVLGLMAHSTLAAAADPEPFQFEIKYTPATDSGVFFVDLPVVSVVVKNNRSVPIAVGDQLTEGAQDVIDRDTSLHNIVVDSRPATAGNEFWSIVAGTEPRLENAALVDSFAAKLTACFRSLPNDVTTATLGVLLDGGILNSGERLTAIDAGQAMLESWKLDRCAVARNNAPLDPAKVKNAADGMLTERFDFLHFGDQAIADLAVVLHPLFYASTGLWVSEKAPQLRRVFETAVKRLPTQAQYDLIANPDFTTFWDFVIAAVSRRSETLRTWISTVASSCRDTVASLSNPFTLKACVAENKLVLVRVRLATVDYFAVQGRR